MNLVKSEAKPIVVIQWRSWSCVTWNGTLSAAKELVQFGTVIKHTREWKLIERNFKIMNLNLLSSWKERKSGKQNDSPVNIRFVAKTSDIRNFCTKIRSDVESSEVANPTSCACRLIREYVTFVTLLKPFCDLCAFTTTTRRRLC